MISICLEGNYLFTGVVSVKVQSDHRFNQYSGSESSE